MPEIPDPRAQAAEKRRRAREQRIRDVRARVVGVAVALFVAVWAGLYIQLVSGNDPALADEPTPVTQSATDDSWSTDDTWSDDSASTDSESSSSQPAAVTTRQS